MIPGKDGGYTPRGIRNRNPGNIRATQPDTWQGQTGIDPKGFAVFKAPRDGLRALGLVLIEYQQRHGIYTLLALTHRYAPASDHNQPTAYAEALLDILHTYPEIHPPLLPLPPSGTGQTPSTSPHSWPP